MKKALRGKSQKDNLHLRRHKKNTNRPAPLTSLGLAQ